MAVRNESVRLSLEDAGFTTGIARDTALVAMFRKELDGLGKTSVSAGSNVSRAGRDVDDLGTKSGKTGKEIDKLSGRLRIAADAALILGPSLAPLGAAAVGGIVTMSAQLGSLAGGLGVTLLAVNGLGDGLKALDAFQLNPTAENLAKLRQELDKLGPSGEHFVRYLDSIEGELKSLQMAARDGALPGFEDGIDGLLQRLPELRDLISSFSEEVGALARDAGDSLGGDAFDGFFEYLRTDGVPILDDTARTIGNLALAGANLIAAFAPLQTNFSGGILDWSRDLAEASGNLDSNAGFQEFLSYIERAGPQVVDTLASVANAVLQIVEATAPLGGPVLTAIRGVSDALATIADSDLGTPIFGALAALALFNRGVALTQRLNQVTWGGPGVAAVRSYGASLGTVITAQDRATMSAKQLAAAEESRAATQKTLFSNAGRGVAVAAGLAVAMSGVAENTNYANTAMLAAAGPWGALAGYGLDLWHSTDGLTDSISGLNAAISSGSLPELTSQIDAARAELKGVDDDRQGLSWGERLLGPLGGLTDAEVAIGGVTGKTSTLRDTLAEAEAKAKDLRSSTAAPFDFSVGGIAGQLNKNAEAAAAEAKALEDATDAMRDHRSEALRSVNAVLNYQQAIDDARKAAKENGKTVDETTGKGRDNLRNLYALADAWNQQGNATKNATGSLSTARKNFLATADAMGLGEQAAKRLANRLFEIPPKRKSQIEVDAGAANAALDGVLSKLGRIVSKTITITAKRAGASLDGFNFDTGGYTGPGPRLEPRGIVHAGEVVIPQDLARRDWSMLSSRYGHLPGFADGGLVKNTTAKASTSSGFNVGGGALFDVTGAVTSQLKALESQLKRSNTALDKERQARDDVASAMASLSSAVAGKFDVNLGDTPDVNPWTSSTAPTLSGRVQQATTEAMALPGIIAALQAAGLTGPALAQALQQMDFGQLQQLAANPGEAGQLGTALGGLYAAQQIAGAAGGSAVYSQSLAVQERAYQAQLEETRGLRRDVREVKAAIKAADTNNTTGQRDQASNFAAGVNNAAATGKDNRVYQNAGRGNR